MADTFQVCVHQPGRRIRSVETDKLEPMPAKVTNWKASGDLFVWVIGGLMLSHLLYDQCKHGLHCGWYSWFYLCFSSIFCNTENSLCDRS